MPLPWFRTPQDGPQEQAPVAGSRSRSQHAPEQPDRRRARRPGDDAAKPQTPPRQPRRPQPPQAGRRAGERRRRRRQPRSRRGRGRAQAPQRTRRSRRAQAGRAQAPRERRAQPPPPQPPRRAPLPEAKRELLVSVDVGEKRVAVLEDDRRRRGLPRAARAPLDRRQHLPRHRRQRPARDGGRVRRDRPREERLPLRRRDRRPRARGPQAARARIQDLIQRGQTILVQAVKDPMKTKGARLTTEISLPGRFVVFVPQRRGARRLAPARRRRAQPAQGRSSRRSRPSRAA